MTAFPPAEAAQWLDQLETCTTPGCDAATIARRLCTKHYQRARKAGEFIGARNAYRHHAGDLRAALTGPLGHDTDNGGGCDA